MNTKLIAAIFMMPGIWTSASAADLNALDEIDVMKLVVSHVQGERLSRLVSKRGISFQQSEDYTAALKSAGATDAVIELLNKASGTQPPQAQPSTANKDSVSRSAGSHHTMSKDSAISYLVHAAHMDEEKKRTDALEDIQKVLAAYPQSAFLHYSWASCFASKAKMDGMMEFARIARPHD